MALLLFFSYKNKGIQDEEHYFSTFFYPLLNKQNRKGQTFLKPLIAKYASCLT